MNEERRQILDMLSEGKISAAEAERLLEKLDGAKSAGHAESQDKSTGRTAKPKFLCVIVDSADGDKVNVKVPLALVKTGIKMAAIMPEGAAQKLSAKGIDLSKLSALDGDELTAALAELQVNVDSDAGDVVRICCE
jgi:hypothetical protein